MKAHMLGAQAVAVGRAILYGAAAGGEAGAKRALQILVDELRLSMMLSGMPSLHEIRSSLTHPATETSLRSIQ